MGGETSEVVGRHHRRAVRGGALGPGDGRPHRPPAQAVQRGGQALGARRRPGSCRWSRSSARSRCWSSTAAARPASEVLDLDHVGRRAEPITLAADLPTRLIGVDYSADAGRRLLDARSAATVDGGRRRALDGAPRRRWRPDLTDPADLVEEVVRLDGYDEVPSVLPLAPPGNGLTAGAAPPPHGRPGAGRGRATSRCCRYPFVAPGVADALGLPADDPRRQRGAAGQPALRGGAAAAHHAAAAAARPRSAQPRPGPARPGALRDGHWSSSRRRRRARRRRWGWTGRPADERVGRRRRGRAGASRGTSRRCSPARSSRPAGGARAGAASWADAVEAARDRARRGRRAGRPDRGARRPSTRRGTRAGARRSRSTARSSGTPASCTRPSARRWSCPSAPARWS